MKSVLWYDFDKTDEKVSKSNHYINKIAKEKRNSIFSGFSFTSNAHGLLNYALFPPSSHMLLSLSLSCFHLSLD